MNKSRLGSHDWQFVQVLPTLLRINVLSFRQRLRPWGLLANTKRRFHSGVWFRVWLHLRLRVIMSFVNSIQQSFIVSQNRDCNEWVVTQHWFLCLYQQIWGVIAIVVCDAEGNNASIWPNRTFDVWLFSFPEQWGRGLIWFNGMCASGEWMEAIVGQKSKSVLIEARRGGFKTKGN